MVIEFNSDFDEERNRFMELTPEQRNQIQQVEAIQVKKHEIRPVVLGAATRHLDVDPWLANLRLTITKLLNEQFHY